MNPRNFQHVHFWSMFFFLYYCSVNISVQHYKEIKLVPSWYENMLCFKFTACSVCNFSFLLSHLQHLPLQREQQINIFAPTSNTKYAPQAETSCAQFWPKLRKKVQGWSRSKDSAVYRRLHTERIRETIEPLCSVLYAGPHVSIRDSLKRGEDIPLKYLFVSILQQCLSQTERRPCSFVPAKKRCIEKFPLQIFATHCAD